MILTEQQRKTVIQALKECDRYIAIEFPRDPNLRPLDVQRRLEFYIQHRAKLLKALETNSTEPLPQMR